MVFSDIIGTMAFLQPQSDDDIVDRLHYYYSSTFLLVTALLISLKMFGGRPIECWVPAEYRGSWEDYTEMFCWARNTYWVSFEDEIPAEVDSRENRMISYYQWTPFFLVISAFAFYLPCLIWRVIYGSSGIRLKDIMLFATDKSNILPDRRRTNIAGLVAHLTSVFRNRYRFGDKHISRHRYFRFLNIRYMDCYVSMLYLCVKLLYIANVIGQMLLMNRFLQTDEYSIYGVGVLIDLIAGRPWHESGNFPRVTLCDMNIRVIGNIQRHTVQCVLVINIFTEKVFILLWLWYTSLIVVSLVSLCIWIVTIVPFEQRKKFVARRLALADINFKQQNHSDEIVDFVQNYIKFDGIFVLKMLSIHAGMMICTEVIDTMWDKYLAENGKSQEFEEQVEASDKEDGGGDCGRQRKKISLFIPLLMKNSDNFNGLIKKK